jgi:hypothetical protein
MVAELPGAIAAKLLIRPVTGAFGWAAGGIAGWRSAALGCHKNTRPALAFPKPEH